MNESRTSNNKFQGTRISGGGAEQERDTESAADSRLWAVSTETDAGLKLKSHEMMTWAEVGHPMN